MAEATWLDFSYLESRDLAAALYRDAHGRRPNAARTISIVAAFAQGRRYFEAAANADYLVKPPLLLYGVIALARGLILFLDPRRGEEALSPAHGVHPDDWPTTLGAATASSALRRLPDLRATFARGTFTEFAAATKNVERGRVITFPPGENLELTSDGPTDFIGETVAFRDALSRVPDLASVYARTFSDRGRCYPGWATHLKDHAATRFDIGETIGLGLPSEADVRDAFTLPPWVEVREATPPWASGSRRCMTFTVNHAQQTDLEGMPWVVMTEDERGFFLSQRPDELHLSLLLSLYLVTFFTGTLARYHPSVWLNLQTPGSGDLYAPIIRNAVEVVERRFPELVMREIRYATSHAPRAA